MKLELKLMQALLALGECSEADLRLMARTWGSARNAKRIVRKLLQSGDLSIRETKLSATDTVRSVALAKSGRIRILDALDDSYWAKHWNDARAQFRISDADRFVRRLNDNRIMAMMMLAEVTVLPHDKPTLYRLVEGCGGMLPKREPSADDYYADHMSDDECRALISAGVYYTNAELRAFLDALGQGDEADVIRASKVRGIFVSDTTAYVVYMAQPGDNKIIATRAFAEQRLLESLKAILSVTHVGRQIKALPRYSINERTNERRVTGYALGEPYALIISDGDAMVYNTANGGPHGKPAANGKTNAMQINPGSVRYINGSSSMYKRIFVAPHTSNGISILSYITHASVEDWLQASTEVIGGIHGSAPSPGSAMYPYTIECDDGAVSAIYMPAYECCELYQIAKRQKRVAIVTYRDMLSAIAHSVRCDVVYYDADTLERIDADDVPVYALNGEIAGKDILAGALAERGLAISATEMDALPQKFEYANAIAFWNGIARGSISVQDVADACGGEPVSAKKHKYVRRARVAMLATAEYSALVKKAAKHNRMSVSAYLKRITHDQVIADAQAYDAELADNKQGWKQER